LVNDTNYKYFQPIDTWVHQIAKQLKIVSSKTPNWKTDAEAIVEVCLKNNVSPIRFNEGSWIMGSFFGSIFGEDKLHVLINNLDKIQKIFNIVENIEH